MEIFKNNVKVKFIELQQYSSNVDNVIFKFKKPLDFPEEADITVEILLENDKYDNIKNNNILLEVGDTEINVFWAIQDETTITSGVKLLQITLKESNKVFLSKVFKINILPSLQTDDNLVVSNISYLAYWEKRMKELAKKIEDFESFDISEAITEDKLTIRLENYVTKEKLVKDLDKKADKNNTYTKSEIDDFLQNINIDDKLEDFQKKEDTSLTTNAKNIVGAINELDDNIKNIDVDLSDYFTKAETTQEIEKKLSKLEIEKYQLKQDDSLTTVSKEIVGAINEINAKPLQTVDLSDYYNKTSIDGKLSTKANTSDLEQYQKKDDELLQTDAKNVVNAINELNKKFNENSQSGVNADLSNYITKDTFNSELNKKLDKTDKLQSGKGIEISQEKINIKVDNKTIGINSDGEIEVTLLASGNEEGNTNILQYTLKNVTSGTQYTIPTNLKNHKQIVQVYAEETPKTINETIKDFNIVDDDIYSKDGIKLKFLHKIDVVDGVSSTIKKSDFVKILKFINPKNF